MWARRCGAPPRLPSKIKVLLQSVGTGAIGIGVFSYMSGADVGYLDLRVPRNPEVLCLSEWPLRHQAADWWRPDMWKDWVSYREDMATYLQKHQCPGLASYVLNASCAAVVVPLQQMDRHLGVPLGTNYEWRNDAVEIYGHLFLYLTFCMWVFVTVHDLALLTVRNRDYVYDLPSIQNGFRCCDGLYKVLGFRCWKRMVRGKGCKCGRTKRCCKKLGRYFGILLAPLWAMWSLLAFFFIVIPVVTATFVIYPIRLSRALVFINCISCGIFGVVLALHSVAYVADVKNRQNYAVTWTMPIPGQLDGCVCGCVYPLSQGRCVTLLGIGVGVAYKSFTLAFRCLKGLRRSNWSNLMSVMFPVPLTVYEVYWTQPDGGPITYRKEGEPVQGELAFDPFALMDEQLNSGSTTVTLQPTAIDAKNEPAGWSVEDVVTFLDGMELGQYEEGVRQKKVDGVTLLELLKADALHDIGVSSKVHASRIRARIVAGVNLRTQVSSVHGNQRKMVGPSIHDHEHHRVTPMEFIGCCGFPCRHRKANSSLSHVSDSDGEREVVLQTPTSDYAASNNPEVAAAATIDLDSYCGVFEGSQPPREREPTEVREPTASSPARRPKEDLPPEAAPPDPTLACSL